MRYSLALAMLICATVVPTGAASAAEARPQPKRHPVSGYLYAHWEYPTFLPDDERAQQAMPFSIEQERWQDFYLAPVVEGQKTRPDQTICFRIIGEGRVVQRTPTDMWPATSTLVISSVKTLVRLPTDAECEARLRPNVR